MQHAYYFDYLHFLLDSDIIIIQLIKKFKFLNAYKRFLTSSRANLATLRTKELSSLMAFSKTSTAL